MRVGTSRSWSSTYSITFWGGMDQIGFHCLPMQLLLNYRAYEEKIDQKMILELLNCYRVVTVLYTNTKIRLLDHSIPKIRIRLLDHALPKQHHVRVLSYQFISNSLKNNTRMKILRRNGSRTSLWPCKLWHFSDIYMQLKMVPWNILISYFSILKF